MLDAQLQPHRCLDPSRGNRLQRLELPAPADDAGSGSAVRRGGLVTPRVSSWSAPTFPAPSGVLVGGPYGSLDAAPEQRRIPPARGTAPPPATGMVVPPKQPPLARDAVGSSAHPVPRVTTPG